MIFHTFPLEIVEYKRNILNKQGWPCVERKIVVLLAETEQRTASQDQETREKSFFLDTSLALPEYVKLTSHLVGIERKRKPVVLLLFILQFSLSRVFHARLSFLRENTSESFHFTFYVTGISFRNVLLA